jgi:hypothetical protein
VTAPVLKTARSLLLVGSNPTPSALFPLVDGLLTPAPVHRSPRSRPCNDPGEDREAGRNRAPWRRRGAAATPADGRGHGRHPLRIVDLAEGAGYARCSRDGCRRAQ